MSVSSPRSPGDREASSLQGYQQAVYTAWSPELRESRVHKARALLRQEHPGVLLDLGCSTGAVSAPFIAEGWTVYGLDVATAPLRQARSAGVKAVVGEVGQSLPLATATCDAVLAGEIIEHLVDTDAFLQEVYRVLRPGGALILTTPNLASLENRLRLLLGIYPIWVDYSLGRGEGHVRAYTPRVLKRQLQEHGFMVERHVGNFVPFVPQRFLNDIQAPWLARTGDWLPGLAMDIIVKARRQK